MLYVRWAGKPRGEGPMQVRLTGIDAAEAERMDPSGAGPRGEPVWQDINKAGEDMSGVSKYRFRLDADRSQYVWKRLCDPRCWQ